MCIFFTILSHISGFFYFFLFPDNLSCILLTALGQEHTTRDIYRCATIIKTNNLIYKWHFFLPVLQPKTTSFQVECNNVHQTLTSHFHILKKVKFMWCIKKSQCIIHVVLHKHHHCFESYRLAYISIFSHLMLMPFWQYRPGYHFVY